MICPNCRTQSSPQARFCQQCGSGLAPQACNACGVQMALGSRFCSNCGKSA
ncbi:MULTISPECIES: double zinc ribbon domain-containing protein [Comamonas]|uniref:double zinc ribbon domain-containing protein n=1 Tax=Comamonas TaxID=283 RepID=UPI001CBAC639|nr:zinc ribbon domain-containing protein [Comamonas thiooxydans]